MHLKRPHMPKKIHGVFKIFGRFSRKSHHYVERERKIWEGCTKFVNPFPILLPAVPSPHEIQYAVRAALERDMNMWTATGFRSQKVNEIIGHMIGIDGTQPKPLQAFYPKQLLHQFCKRRKGTVIHSICSQLNPEKHKLAVPVHHKALRLLQNRMRSPALKPTA